MTRGEPRTTSFPPRDQTVHRVVPENPDEGSCHDGKNLCSTPGKQESRNTVVCRRSECARDVKFQNTRERLRTPQALLAERPQVIENEIEYDRRFNRGKDCDREAHEG